MAAGGYSRRHTQGQEPVRQSHRTVEREKALERPEKSKRPVDETTYDGHKVRIACSTVGLGLI